MNLTVDRTERFYKIDQLLQSRRPGVVPIATFLEEAPGMLADLRSAREAGDGERFRRAAHSLKSNSQTFGALTLGKMARELELRGLHALPAQDAAALDALDAAYRQAAAALEEHSRG